MIRYKVILTFADRETERLFVTGLTKRFQTCARQAFQKLRMLDAATKLADLGALPGNRLEQLRGDRRGEYSIRINDQYRVCFEWREANAYQVRIEDYH